MAASVARRELPKSAKRMVAAVDTIKKYVSQLQEKMDAAENKTCNWTWNDVEDRWETDCREAYCFIDGGPKENNMEYCCYCGSRIPLDPD
jgi:hypothetical protein